MRAPLAADEPRGAVTSTLLLLIRDPQVQRELRLSPEQIRDVTTAIEAADGPLFRLRDVAGPDRESQAAKHFEQLQRDIADVLDVEQAGRLRQLVIQAEGVTALTWPDVAAELGLAERQVHRMRRILDETRGEIEKLQAASADSASADEIARLRTRGNEQVLEVLSASQRSAIADLVGSAYDFSRVRQVAGLAPELHDVEEWINSEPLTMKSLRGKVVALHYWAFG
jgi:hypothetical protein